MTIDEGAATVVEIQASNVPPGTLVKLHLFSLEGPDQIVTTDGLTGTPDQSSVTVNVTFPPGFTRGFARVVWR